MRATFTTVSRATVSDTGVISGYAAVFGVPTARQADYPGKTESIGRTAFNGLLEDDALATRNHNPDNLLGRVSSGTLKLSADDHGLKYEIQPGDTQIYRDTLAMIKRGDLAGASFIAEVGDIARDDQGNVTHTQFKRLIDVGPVALPAYPETSAVARSEHPGWSVREQLIRARHRAHRKETK